ncbi:MAG: 3-oxoacyl-ACP synthase III [Zetaproteobacteria bacterium]|nr:3-oxoacyl-ACP synthase III [Zetaproteobacteria bacterium]
MQYRRVRIAATGYYLPEEILTSSSIEKQLHPLMKKLGLPKGYLESLTGVQERRTWPVGSKPSELGKNAAEEAFKVAPISKNQIECVIHTGVCRDALEPATAAVVHHKLGLEPECMVFDISNACLGFLNGICTAANMIELGQIQSALIVSGENAGPIYQDTISQLAHSQSRIEMEQSIASMTLGSGAVAFILTNEELAPYGARLLGATTQTDSKHHHLCEGNGNIYHQQMKTDTRMLLKQGLILSQVTWELFKREFGFKNSDFKHLFSHQVSKSHQQKVFECLKLDPTRGYNDVALLGNTGSVAAPLSLALRSQENKISRGDLIAMLGIGSGLNCMMMGVEW